MQASRWAGKMAQMVRSAGVRDTRNALHRRGVCTDRQSCRSFGCRQIGLALVSRRLRIFRLRRQTICHQTCLRGDGQGRAATGGLLRQPDPSSVKERFMWMSRGTKWPLRKALSRRQLLQVGGLGMLGLSLPEFLSIRSVAAPWATSRREKSCILIVQYGGASHIDSWDPKPGAPREIRGPYRPIATRVPGLQMSELQPRLAQLADRYCLIRSLTHHSVDHGEAMQLAMTGSSRPDKSQTDDTPYFGSVLAKLRPATRPVPSYVFINSNFEPRHLTGGYLGQAYAPLRIGTDEGYPVEPVYGVSAFDPAEAVSAERLAARSRLLASLDPPEGHVGSSASGRDYQRLRERAWELVSGPEARLAFDLEREPGKVRDRYGRHPLGQHLVQARRLIE